MTGGTRRLTVAGVGLIGGSLALAARAAGLVDEVVGFGRSRGNLETALARGIIDRIARDDADAAAADVILLAAPLAAGPALAARFRPHAAPGTILTDVGSVKAGVVAALERAWTSPGLVVGAHPIAGSERSGSQAADVALFRGRRCILTPTTHTAPEALARVRRLWEGVGAVVEVLPGDVHDAILARVSHLPHVAAYALVGAVANGSIAGHRVLDYAGTGFTDTTRIAASPAEVWRDILLANAAPLRDALGELRQALDAIEQAVASGDATALEAVLDMASAARRAVGGGS